MKSIGSGFLTLSVSNVLFIASAYLTNIFLARFLNPTVYGEYGLLISIMTLVNLVQVSGLPQATSKFISANETKQEQILKSSIILQIISTLIIAISYFLLAKLIALILKDRSLITFLQFSSLIFPFYGIFALYTGYYNGLHLFKKQATLNIIYSIFKLITVVSLAYYYHLYGAIAGFIIAPLVALLFGIMLPDKLFSSKVFPYKKLILYSLPLIGYAFFSTLIQSIDLYFVKAIQIGENEVGYYAANQNISRIPYFALSAFSVVMFPSISRSVSEKNKEKTDKLIKESLRYILLLLVPITLLISGFSKEILNLLFSSAYESGASSLSILTIALGILTLFNFYGNILNGGGYPRTTVISAIVGVVVTGLSCYFLIPLYFLNGAAVSTLIGSAVTLMITGVFVHKKFEVEFPYINSIKILVAGLTVYLISGAINTSPIFTPLAMLFLFGMYILLLFGLKEINRKDLEHFLSFIPLKPKNYGPR